jgi:hypothetical protein
MLEVEIVLVQAMKAGGCRSIAAFILKLRNIWD